MRTPPLTALTLALCLTVAPALAQITTWGASDAAPDLPPGLESARLLPGWTDAAGDRVMALQLDLQPGWKTYWRSPGDTGLPPQFAWAGSENLAGVTLHWPAPQAIRSGDRLDMGYQDRLVLPFTAHAADPSRPVGVAAQIDLGLCEAICVPARLTLVAPDPGTRPDPVITAALASEPRQLSARPACRIVPIADGLRVAVDLPRPDATLAAIELSDRPEIWVSGADLGPGPDGMQAVVEMIGPSARPFDLDPGALRLTVVANDGAVQMSGCDPAG